MAEIQAFCTTNFGVQFPMFEKIVAKGAGIHPLYQALIEAQPQADNLGDDGFAKKLAGYGIVQASPRDVLWNPKNSSSAAAGRSSRASLPVSRRITPGCVGLLRPSSDRGQSATLIGSTDTSNCSPHTPFWDAILPAGY